MRWLHSFVIIIGVTTAIPCYGNHVDCVHVRLKVTLEITSATLSLSDLLDPGTCPRLLDQARDVQLGKTPLRGSVRVIRREELLSALKKILPSGAGREGLSTISAPDRITVRNAAHGRSCLALGNWVQTAAHSVLPSIASPEPGHQGGDGGPECGLPGLVPDGVPLKILRKGWNPRLGKWDVLATCVQAAACLPFLVRLQGPAPQPVSVQTAGLVDARRRDSHAAAGSGMTTTKSELGPELMVQRGARVSLSWEGRGVRMVVPAISLENGGPGAVVHVRTLHGGRVASAVVVRRNLLRADL